MTNWPVWEGTCAYCGAKNEDEDPHYRLECPSCSREGCSYCMPFGRGIVCPECEDKGGRDA